MARTEINGIGIEYEVFGEGPLAVITPGGRFSKDTPGIRELAQDLAKGGLTAVIWDRPNCGASDLCFEGESESILNADVLAELIRHLGRGPAYLVAGSAGSRVSLLAATRRPDVVSRMFLFWISGGAVSLASLGTYYYAGHAIAAATGGMEAVAALPDWQEQLAKNPGARDHLLAQDPWTFIDTMQRWCAAFFPTPGSPVPGLSPAEAAKMQVPVMVLRSGKVDLYHTREVSEAMQRLIPGAQIAEPPWGDDEWYVRTDAQARGEGLFGNWPALVPQILEFARS
ncbi:alpha/beta hydrolase [Phenylobacterium sp. LjRoot225]|uniref:alpha/beta fold hydrolase n=1 Tax=Phenylobacterium sp. LjRoot225 TaxID=3342285 RepID=UPI003ECD6097